MKITKLFSKLRLVKNWQFGRGKREALSTKNREHFLFSHENPSRIAEVRRILVPRTNLTKKC